MATPIYVVPTGDGNGIVAVCLGMLRALDCLGIRVGYCKLIEQDNQYDPSFTVFKHLLGYSAEISLPPPITLDKTKTLLGNNQEEKLLEEAIEIYSLMANGSNFDAIIIEGLMPLKADMMASKLNTDLARALDAFVVFVGETYNCNPKELNDRLEIAISSFGGFNNSKIIGCILNNLYAPKHYLERELPAITIKRFLSNCNIFKTKGFNLIGYIPWKQKLVAPRMLDIVDKIKARCLNAGELEKRRVYDIIPVAGNAANLVEQLKPNTLLIAPGDRDDVLLCAAMATMKGIQLAGIILTDNLLPDAKILKFCDQAMNNGLPIVTAEGDFYSIAQQLFNINIGIANDDLELIELVMNSVADCLHGEWIKKFITVEQELHLSPAAFRYTLTKQARDAQKKIVLPEGEEPRTIEAAIICTERRIAQCILLGDPEKIYAIAEAKGLEFPSNLEIIEPKKAKEKYIQALYEIRKDKGMTLASAEDYLDDPVVVGTMMLHFGAVDGLVSGAINTTANTIRPALQIIRTKKHSKLVSSVFFMCLPEQVLVYGDCAVNPDPTAEELADIAIQSAESALAFGIEPRVAMISYSTGSSGAGVDVEKVKKATEIAKSLRPDLSIDGPLQYDAAAIEAVGKQKAPNSKVAGRATVFVFPDLNTGNTTYKAVQRSANVVSIGPMLQGLNKPVNDLSRGASVDDIIYTIALTAIQANYEHKI